MEKNLGKESDFFESSSKSAVESSTTEKAKSKKKKKKRCTCKGFPSETSSVDVRAQKKKFENSEWFRQWNAWKDYIRRHREDVRHAKPIVDDAAPKLNLSTVYDPEVLKYIWSRLREIFELTQGILKNLHEGHTQRGKTDTFGYNYSRLVASNYAARREEARYTERQNQLILKILKSTKSRMMSAKEYAKEWKKHEEVMENSSQFPLWWKVKKKEAAVEIGPPVTYFRQHVTEKSAKYPDKRPRVFLEISIKNVGVVGKMVVMLFSDYVPMTVKNFLAFCDPKAELTYKGNFFYLIFQNYYCQTGDVVENRGFGGTSIYGPYFGNEDFTLNHSERGILTMYTKISNRNASQFLITFRKLESLDGQNVVFGKIVKGLHVLDTIESVGTKKTGRPKVEIYISDCDEI